MTHTEYVMRLRGLRASLDARRMTENEYLSACRAVKREYQREKR